jgi:Raf kinase inhibitor-like YbhB/YbcL family protein
MPAGTIFYRKQEGWKGRNMNTIGRPLRHALVYLTLVGAGLTAIPLVGCGLPAAAHAQQSMQLSSQDFLSGGAIPLSHEGNAWGCTGQNQPLVLSWTGIPAGARSLALTMIDYTAPKPGGFTHWLVYNIGPSTTGTDPSTLGSALQGYNDTGATGYIGPCPPPGPAHYYTMTLYALNTQFKPQHMTLTQLQQAMKSHVLAVSTLVGVFQLPPTG